MDIVPFCAIMGLASWSALPPSSMMVLSMVLRMRAALTTLTTWKPPLAKLTAMVEERGTLAVVGSGSLSPFFWRSTPLVMHVEAASRGHFGTRELSEAAACALAALENQTGPERLRVQRLLSPSLRVSLFPDGGPGSRVLAYVAPRFEAVASFALAAVTACIISFAVQFCGALCITLPSPLRA
ncbi:unnamed protein product [Prorocentrum cordatum]|uniref:Uncharacterized protein n=1 Tax=Prorocentrum cordatum TaxID=2364126 RepID=A0ABN9V7T4_9DINO|nr:unnamed protein product [Polarella glacialis]